MQTLDSVGGHIPYSFVLLYDVQAFIIASTATEEEMLRWYGKLRQNFPILDFN
jgi:hypothetical protein